MLGKLELVTACYFASLSTVASALPPPDTLVPYPNPLITEIHYNVRTDGDATTDGQRDAVGDEFIEIINPHDKPIRLRGFTLVDSDAYSRKSASSGGPDKDDDKQPRAKTDNVGKNKPADKVRDPHKPTNKKDDDATKPGEARQVKFTFPDVELKPGEVAVVFNGYKQQIPGSVGSELRPHGPNENFHDARVFSMRIGSRYAAFDNNGDWVLLVDPSGKPVQLVRWGKPKEKEPQHVPLVEDAPESDGSVQRDGLCGKLKPHDTLRGYEKLMFSPGRFDFPGKAGAKVGESGGGGEQPDSERDRKPARKRP